LTQAAGPERGAVEEGTLLWEPSAERIERSRIAHYMQWLAEERGRRFDSYDDLWRWSVDSLEEFWASLWDYFAVKQHQPYVRVLAPSPAGKRIEGARWFEGATLNWAEHALSRRDDHPAIIAAHESGTLTTTTYAELWERAAQIAAGLRKLGVRRGDGVVAYLPNTTDAVAAAIATASIGAAWSSCPPEFGTPSVIDRFAQVGPKVLLAADGYTYNGKRFESLEAVASIEQALPSLVKTVVLPYLDAAPSLDGLANAIYWDDLLVSGQELTFEPVPFDHPLWIVYSSGTTGTPKAIVHGHGGTVLEHLKAVGFHLDVGENDRFFWFSTTGWIMWNILLGGLMLGSTIVLYDGSPAYPDMNALWGVAERAKITTFGISAPYILGCMKAGIEPSRELDLSSIRTVGSTGAPLPPEGYAWIYEHVGRDLMLGSISGGTDMLTAIIMSCPLLPIHSGEMQCMGLGCKVESFDDAGNSIVDQVGELVITEPMPSLPVRFLNDPDGTRYHESYFDVYPDVWRHGDWLKITPRGTSVIYGRSDATLNRSGVRMGTSEFYRVIEEMPEVLDSLVIDTSRLGAEGKLLLFVVLRDDATLDDALRKRMAAAIRASLSPRHVPDDVRQIIEVPRTLNGKKLEVPVKRILAGEALELAVSMDALANPEALRVFVDMASEWSDA
jgi:acetoacetyl-CoA synthetase